MNVERPDGKFFSDSFRLWIRATAGSKNGRYADSWTEVFVEAERRAEEPILTVRLWGGWGGPSEPREFPRDEGLRFLESGRADGIDFVWTKNFVGELLNDWPYCWILLPRNPRKAAQGG